MLNRSLLSTFLLLLAGVLAGCGIGPVDTSTSTGPMMLSGIVHGGQQPINGAKVYMFAAGKSGNGSAATSMLQGSGYVLTGPDGSFSINSDYVCASPTDQIYMAAVGGNPGLGAGTNNAALVMLDALGSCSGLSSGFNIYIDEVTTVAAVWTLAPFMTSYTNIGASATNSAGLANAFADAALLADPKTGLPPVNLAANLTTQTDKLYALADALAGCVNSDGTTGCNPLFTAATPSGGVAPTNTVNAALNIAKNPGQNLTAVFNAIPPTTAFPTGLSAAPYDWTLSMVITGGGLQSATAMDIDTGGNVWVADYFGAVSEFSAQGTPLSPVAGFGVGALNEVYGLTIDTNGYIWVTNQESSPNAYGSLTKFDGSNTATPGTIVTGTGGGTNFYDSTIDFPNAVAADTNGNIYIANYANSSATRYSSAGAYLANVGSGNASFPVGVAVDSNHGVWIANLGDDTITHSDQNGNILSRPVCCHGANGLATDKFGNVWVANYYNGATGSFSEVGPDGSVLLDNSTVGGVSYPAGVAVDAAQNVWIADYGSQAISEIAGAGGTLAAGTAISPSYGYGYGGPGLTAPLLLEPYSAIPDASGNVWVTNHASGLVVFFGLAAPTATPTLPVPVAP